MSILDILFTTLIMPIQLVLETFFMVAYRLVGNPGIAIIVLSLVMNFLILPLYMRADKMQEHERDVEAKLHAGVAHIRKTFKGDEKTMMLQTYYRQNDYSPLDVFKGSISLLLEIPFFIAAYMYLSHQPLLNGVSFWFIKDLGAPDGLLTVGDMHINVLPFVMTAINLATCLMFTKGMPAKTKAQLYVMAALFLILLYDSPAGLVFYWTLNNVFSFVKTLFYKLKNPRQVLAVLAAVVGVVVLVAGHIILAETASLKLRIATICFGLVLMVPLVVMLLRRRGIQMHAPCFLKEMHANKKIYVACALLLVVLCGLLIPSAVIGASPQEFIDKAYFVDPIWYIVSSLCLSVGSFLIWMSVFYWLTAPRYKPLFQLLLIAFCGIAIVDYMFFGTNFGMLTSTLQYETGLAYTLSEKVINLFVLVVVAVVLGALAIRFSRQVVPAVTIVCVAMAVMGAYNVVTIEQQVSDAKDQIEQYQESMPSFTLDKDGKNVVIIMLDRAMGCYIPFIFNEFPELKDVYAGFTYYENTLSYGISTNYALPPLFGGYEYTPAEMNKRGDELLVDKHDEALKVLPTIFANNGYDVTFCDPVYAGYQWIPDLSIFDDCEGVTTYITSGKFRNAETSEWITDANEWVVDANKRDFFYFSMMKIAPVFFQGILYDDGVYNKARSNVQILSDDGLIASGTTFEFIDEYTTLQHLATMTGVDSNANSPGSFVILTNTATHDPILLQEPGYEPAGEVDNRAYENEHHDRFTLSDKSIVVENEAQYKHYQTNVAALREVGNWLDYLKENDVYNNTRIIIVSDHGRNLDHVEGRNDAYYPLLLVKDFDATGFTVSNEFMTNADVPLLAMNGLIENPTNPFTTKSITDDAKRSDMYVAYVAGVAGDRKYWGTDYNNGTTFLVEGWLLVQNGIFDYANWIAIDAEKVVPGED